MIKATKLSNVLSLKCNFNLYNRVSFEFAFQTCIETYREYSKFIQQLIDAGMNRSFDIR